MRITPPPPEKGLTNYASRLVGRVGVRELN